MQTPLIFFFIFNIFFQTHACQDNVSFNDLLKDPEIRAMLNKPRVKVDEPEFDLGAERAKEIEEAKLEMEALEGSRNATPAEKARARSRYEKLVEDEEIRQFTESAEFDRLMSTPVTLSSRSTVGRATEGNPQNTASVDKPDEPDFGPITDEDRSLFSDLLKGTFKPRSTRHPYDNFLNDFKNASQGNRIPVEYRHPLTGEYMEAQVIEYIGEKGLSDLVKVRYVSPDGRVITRDVPMTTLRVEERGKIVNLGDRETLFDSDRFGDLPKDSRSQLIVNEMASSAIYDKARKRYRELQEKLDGGGLSIEEMQMAINEQDDLWRSFSPMRKVERETIELNLAGLEEGDSLSLSPGEKRAIAEIQEIYEIRQGNPYSDQDVELFSRLKGFDEASIIQERVKKHRGRIGREIRSMTGENRGVDIPFELKKNSWSSSKIKNDIGGITGSTRKKEALDAVSAFEKQGQILSSEMARDLSGAIRNLRSDLKNKGINEGPSSDYLRYLELRVELYNLSFR